MADFESGVSRYIVGAATVRVTFPVDYKGHQDICCRQCWFYRRTYSTCGLNGCVCEFPEKYVGSNCPLHIVDEEDNEWNLTSGL